MKNIIEFSHPEDPLPFADSFGDDLDAEVFDNCILSVYADNSFTIFAQSELVVVGRLSSTPKGVNTSASEIYGLVTPESDVPHPYSVFGASELVKVLVIQLFLLGWLTLPLNHLKFFVGLNWQKCLKKE